MVIVTNVPQIKRNADSKVHGKVAALVNRINKQNEALAGKYLEQESGQRAKASNNQQVKCLAPISPPPPTTLPCVREPISDAVLVKTIPQKH